MKPLRLIYGYDALCGWCFGFIPALQAFAKAHPDINIEVLPGGLFTGDRARPYNALVDHITNAFPRVTSVTGQAPDDRFWAMIKRADSPLANSTLPNMAVALIAQIEPERAVEFAHRLQEIHFIEAADYNDPASYETLRARHGFAQLDIVRILAATDETPIIAEAYAMAARLGIQSYPTVLIVDADDNVLANLPSIYDPAAFETIVLNALSELNGSLAAAQ